MSSSGPPRTPSLRRPWTVFTPVVVPVLSLKVPRRGVLSSGVEVSLARCVRVLSSGVEVSLAGCVHRDETEYSIHGLQIRIATNMSVNHTPNFCVFYVRNSRLPHSIRVINSMSL